MSCFVSLHKFQLTVFLTLAVVLTAYSQNPADDTDVLRINSSLIKAGVSVYDKNGEFVSGLKIDDFVVKVDGKQLDKFFFDPASFKNPSYKTKGGAKSEKSTESQSGLPAQFFQRNIAFVIDDVHLSAESVIRARNMVSKFIDREMLPFDNVTIISTSGKTGFLSQFSDELTVLNAALQRVTYSALSGADMTPPPMSEFEAQSIVRLDRDVTELFINRLLRDNPRMSPLAAEGETQARARAIMSYTKKISGTTLDALEGAIRLGSLFDGRKAIYFISDGFLLDPGNSDATDRLNRLSSLAVRSNTVIYSFDAKGLDASVGNSAFDLSSPPAMSGRNRLGNPTPATAFSLKAGQAFESQDGLSNIAYNTGGRFVKNTNDLSSNLSQLTQEAFTLYMLSWEPETESDKPNKFHRIEVSVRGRPELKVRVQSGYFDSRERGEPQVDTKVNFGQEQIKKSDESDPLIRAAKSISPKNDLPTTLAVRFLNVSDDDAALWATIQLSSDALTFTENNKLSNAKVDIAGLIYNSDGRLEKSFKAPLTISVPAAELRNGNARFFNYEYKTALKPGLYQMRVSSLDKASGKTGSFARWIEIPDLSSKHLTLSSIVLAEVRGGIDQNQNIPNGGSPATLDKNISNRFTRDVTIRYAGFIYNAAIGGNLSVRMQLIQNGQSVFEGSPNFVKLDKNDSSRIPFIGEIDISKIPAGFYEVKVTVKDESAKTTTFRRVNIEIL